MEAELPTYLFDSGFDLLDVAGGVIALSYNAEALVSDSVNSHRTISAILTREGVSVLSIGHIESSAPEYPPPPPQIVREDQSCRHPHGLRRCFPEICGRTPVCCIVPQVVRDA